MAPFRSILVMVAALAVLSACGRNPAADIVMVAGQSNALGYLTAADVPEAFRTADPQVLIWRDGAFQPLQPGRNTGSPNRPDAWGPEASFARAWRAARPDRPLYVVKLARGSTSLAPAEGPDWSPSSGELFAQAGAELEAAKAALRAQGLSPRLAAVVWVQGESDAVHPVMASAYRTNLTSFIQALRQGWSAADTPVAMARIGRIGSHADQVRAAQAAVDKADPLTVSVDAEGLPMQPDGLHISAEGQLRLGEALAAAVLPIVR